MNTIVKIKDLHLPKLNNAEYTQFQSNLAKLVEVATPQKLGFTDALFNAFKDNIQKLTDIAKQSKISDETADLTALDKKRDEEVVYLLTTIKNERKSPIEARKSAAVSLHNITKIFAGVQRLPNRQETQTIESLVLDLEKAENLEKVNTLGLKEVLSALKATNQKYKELTADRAENQAVKILESAKEVRQKTDAQYDEITTRAFVSSVANPTEETQKFILHLNKLIEDTQTAYKQRGTRKSKEG